MSKALHSIYCFPFELVRSRAFRVSSQYVLFSPLSFALFFSFFSPLSLFPLRRSFSLSVSLFLLPSLFGLKVVVLTALVFPFAEAAKEFAGGDGAAVGDHTMRGPPMTGLLFFQLRPGKKLTKMAEVSCF